MLAGTFWSSILYNKKLIICAVGRLLPVAINLDSLLIYECCLFVHRVMMHLKILID